MSRTVITNSCILYVLFDFLSQGNALKVLGKIILFILKLAVYIIYLVIIYGKELSDFVTSRC